MTTLFQEMSTRRQLRDINDWFTGTSRYGDFAPIHCVTIAIDQFLDDCKCARLDLCVTTKQFYKEIYTMICQMYAHRNKTNPDQYIQSLDSLPKPDYWTTEHEIKWIDYLEYKYFDSLYWERFWKTIPESALDNDLYNWRSELGSRIIYYIDRSINALIDEGMIDEEEAETFACHSDVEEQEWHHM